MLFTAIALWRDGSPAPNPTPSAPSPAARTIDLSNYAARGSAGQPQPNRIFSLPRATIDLDLFLPYLSRPGRYHVTVRREHRADTPLTSMDGIADAVGTRTKLRIRLNLRDLPNGRYYLCIVEQGKNASSFYPFELN